MDMSEFKKGLNLVAISPEQKERAVTITSIVSLKIELELGSLLYLLPEGEELEPKIYAGLDLEYLISCEATELGPRLIVKGRNRLLHIDMLGGELMIADGIEELDLDYWLEVENKFTVKPQEP